MTIKQLYQAVLKLRIAVAKAELARTEKRR